MKRRIIKDKKDQREPMIVTREDREAVTHIRQSQTCCLCNKSIQAKTWCFSRHIRDAAGQETRYAHPACQAVWLHLPPCLRDGDMDPKERLDRLPSLCDDADHFKRYVMQSVQHMQIELDAIPCAFPLGGIVREDMARFLAEYTPFHKEPTP